MAQRSSGKDHLHSSSLNGGIQGDASPFMFNSLYLFFFFFFIFKLTLISAYIVFTQVSLLLSLLKMLSV